MAKHIWSIISEQSIVDMQSKKLSLINALEELHIRSKSEPTSDEWINIPIKACFTSYLSRSNDEEPERFSVRLRVKSPDNREYKTVESENVDLETHKRTRHIMFLQSIPYCVPGEYSYILELGSDGNYQEAATIPLDISMTQLD